MLLPLPVRNSRLPIADPRPKGVLAKAPASICRICSLTITTLAALGLSNVLAMGNSSEAPTQPQPQAQLWVTPMHFELNKGQTAEQVDFVSRGPGYTVFLTPGEAVLSLQANKHEHQPAPREQSARRAANPDHLRMSLVAANRQARVEGLEQLEGTANYFMGRDPKGWHSAIPTFAKVKYQDVYPGVDLVYYGNQRQLEYDFIVHPNADPRQIKLRFEGARKLEIDSTGALIIEIGHAKIRWKKPFAYQETENGRQEVTANFQLRNRKEVSFRLGTYDRSRTLVIDPVLVYATYLGGLKADFAVAITVDTNGNVYVIGDTSSLNFPTKSAYRTTSAGSNDVFVTKLSANGSSQVYSTYLGGSGDEFGGGITLDAGGNVYLTGHTDSPNFPVRNAAYNANAGFFDIYLTKLGPFGSNLVYSTYLGGNGDDFGRAVAVDSGANVYVTGRTFSKGTGSGPFPTTQGAYQGANGGGNAISADAFVTKFNVAGTVTYSTFLGGQSDEEGQSIVVDSAGNAYVAGEVTSQFIPFEVPDSDFPTVNAFQSQFNRGGTNVFGGTSDGFITKFNAAGSGLIFSTFFGGYEDDTITGIALDPASRICISGITGSTNLPTLNAAQPVNGGVSFPGPDAFVSVLQSNAASLYYSTYLGGSIDEFSFLLDRFGIAVDKFGNLYISGQTASFDFPLTQGADQTNSIASLDCFVAKINPAVSGPAGLIYSSLITGSTIGADNESAGIAVDLNGNFYVAGVTTATNFPATNFPGAPFRGTNSGNYDSFIAKFSSPRDLSVTMFASSNSVTVGSNSTYTIRINNNGRESFSGVTNFVQFPSSVRFGFITNSLGGFSTSTNGLVTFHSEP